MKVLFASLLLLFAHQLYAQNFEDDFSDGDFTSNPVWSGADSNFVIFELDGNNALRLNDNEASTSYLSTASSNVIGEWEFFVRIDGGAPSNSNRAEVYLMSDIADLDGAVNGYALRIGQTGDDVFTLVRFDAGSQSTILQDTTIFQAGGEYRVKVSRDGSGSWSIEVGEGYNGDLKNSGNTALDNTHTSSSFFGVWVSYTSTRTDDFYFDFKIDPPPVIIDPLMISSFEVQNQFEIDIAFTREVDVNTVQVSDFILNGSTFPNTVSDLSNDTIRVAFNLPIPGGENELFISGIESFNNDTVLTDTTLNFFIFDEFLTGDVIINEFLKDPPSGSGLSEYIELRNTSSKYLNLNGWQIGDNSSLAEISSEDLILLPDSFLVITSDPDALTAEFGEGVYVDVSLPALNNTTDQIRVFDPEGNSVDSLEYTLDWGGVDVALERRSPDLASTFQANWGDSPSAIGTPGRQNDIELDTEPPGLESWEFLNDSTLLLVFTEEIKSEPAENPDNYYVAIPVAAASELQNGENDFLRATFFSPDTVLIDFFDPPYSGGLPNSFVIENQEDVFGNISSVLVFEYQLLPTAEALPGDIAINEFMYDPADGYTEFIEINSHTDKIINLKGWTLSDNSGNHRVITEEDFFITSYGTSFSLGLVWNQHTILVPGEEFTESAQETIIMGSNFPILNNTSDAIVIKNAEGITIDSLTYFSSWGGDEVSLERRSVDFPATFRENWGDSPSENLATPARENAIGVDTLGPQLIAASTLSSTEIQLVFNEAPVEPTVSDTSNFKVSGLNEFDRLEVAEDTVTLIFLLPFEDGQTISIRVLNQSDVFGNNTLSQNIEVTYVEIQSAQPAQVVINEILYRRADAFSPEFVELYNNSDNNFDLSGWKLIDAGNNDAELPDGTLIFAGEYLVLTDQEDFAASVVNGIYLNDFPSLNDSGDEVIIKDAEGATMDSLFYESDWGGDSPGVSLERRDPEAASNDPSNWGTSTAEGGFSAGTESALFEIDVTAPEIIFAVQIDTLVRVVFSEFVRIDGETSFFVNSQETLPVDIGEIPENELYLTWYPAFFVDNNKRASTGRTNVNVEIRNIRDVKGNLAQTITSVLASPISQGSIVINEIMFDPLADSDDNLPDQTEYVELYNPTNEAISLEGITIHDAPDEDDGIRIIEPVSSEFKWIPSGGYFLIYSEDAAETFTDSRIAQYFSLEGESDQFTMRVDRSSLSLASSGDAIFIADSSGATIDSVFYDESWHNPNVFDTDGIALERINPQGSSNDESNWSSSTDISGGTPTMQNTIFQEPGSLPPSSGISFSPNPFSPDDDGFEDNLFINYTLDAPDYLLRVRIFDRYGREVRELADGVQAGFEGSLIWDGLTDDRRKNRVGIYIVLFEAYNSASGRDRTFKETVVLARMF
ncbi:MAG: hypothetical protein ED557_06745 [Balneola sp.]|nr:MAG: hypothetical protein ED557_06745 [Balneola sp.]